MTLPSARGGGDGQPADGDPPRQADAGSDEKSSAASGGKSSAASGGKSSAGRDRDAAGRPRNARPRDRLGRPLSRGAVGEPALEDEAALPPAGALAFAQQLIDDGRPFRAHEVLEASWKAAPAAERVLWKSLAQVAVGLTHAQRGNARGAIALLRRGAEGVGGYASDRPHGIDAADVAGAAGRLADLIERAGLGAIPADRMRVRLSPSGPPGEARG